MSVILAESAEFEVGLNKILTPQGSRVALQPNQGRNLTIAGLIINSSVPNQSWILSNGRNLQLNCGRYKSSPAFIHLSANSDLLSGCVSVTRQTLQTPNGDYVVILEDSKIDLFPNGDLLSSSKTLGRIHIGEDETLAIEEGSSLRFHENGNLYFLYPKQGEHFSASTEISSQTHFQQPVDSDPFPVMFHENGQISTALLTSYNNYDMTFTAYGSDVNFTVSSGPVGFDKDGNIDRILSTDSINLVVQEETFVRSTEVTTDIISYGKFTPGMEVTIIKQSQLFLVNEDGVKRLRAYPENGSNGLIYFNELSNEPFTQGVTKPLYSTGLNN